MKTLYQKTLGGKHGWLWCFMTMLIAAGLYNLHYPLSGQLLTIGDGTSSVLIPEWFGKQYASGQLPLWSSESAAGIPISSHMLGAFFLIPVLFAQLPLIWFTYVNYVFFIAFGACFFARYLNELGVDRKLSIAMGFVLLFCCYYGGPRKYHTAIIESISLYPLVFFAFQRFLNTRKRSAIVLAGLGCGTLLLTATPAIQYAMYLMLGLFLYVLIGCIVRKMKAKDIVCSVLLFLGVTVAAGAVQVIPGYLLMQRYSALCATTGIPYESFVSFSIHPLKLLIAFFPRLFTNIYASFGNTRSSEMDIELFLGTVAAATIVFGLIRYRRDRRVWLPATIAFFVFLYAANGNIPYLSELLYKLPLLNSVRCPSRCLFLFVILQYTILGVTLSRICGDPKELTAYRRFLVYYTAALAVVLAAAYLSPLRDVLERANEINMDGGSVALSALGPIVLLQLLLFACGRIGHTPPKKLSTICLAAGLTLACIFETMPFASAPISAAAPSQSAALQQISEANDNAKTITTHNTINGINSSETFSANMQLHTGVPSLNTYFTYNNPYLCQLMGLGTSTNIAYWNYSGLQTGYGSIYELLKNNEILSVLGVKYIEDQTGIFSQTVGVADYSSAVPVFTTETLELPVCTADFQCIPYMLPLEQNATYLLSFDAETEAVPAVFYLDFAGSGYDDTEQDANVTLAVGSHHYTTVIYSGSGSIPSDSMVRIVAINKEAPISIRNFTVSRVKADNDVYQPLDGDAEGLYYLNTRAKELLFTVREARQISDMEEIAYSPYSYDFTDVVYSEAVETTDLSEASTTLSDITWLSNHTLQAHASGNSRNFVVFSQCFDPSWRVYVDGQRVENYRVDLALQGFWLEAGEHTITYEYCPIDVYVCLGVTALTYLLGAAYLILSAKRDGQARVSA